MAKLSVYKVSVNDGIRAWL